MSFEIEIKDNIIQAFQTFDKLQKGEVFKAARTSINRTLTTLRKESVIEIKKEFPALALRKIAEKINEEFGENATTQTTVKNILDKKEML